MMKMTELDKLFDIQHGNKFDLNKMTQVHPSADSLAFIGRSGERNGVVANVDRVTGVKPFQSGLITVALGGSALSSFVQFKPFYTAQNIDVLRPKTDMSLDLRFYYCLCIEANRFRYSTFGREANRTLHSLLVPSLSSVPSWVSGCTRDALEELREDLSIVGNFS